VIDVVKSVAGAPAHLVGQSLGTLVAQHVAVEAPEWVRSLTLFGPVLEPGAEARERLRARAQTARRSGLVAIADGAPAALSSSSRGQSLAVAFLRESHMRQEAEGFAQTCEALAEAERADLRLIRCPVSIATGDEDGVAPPSVAQALADRLKGARIKLFERCGHWTPIERPKECGKFAADFIRSVEA
jgi:pimeloyl-ACP methyl ester carboxylesterase